MKTYAKAMYPKSKFEDVISWMQKNNFLVVVNKGHSKRKKYCVMDSIAEKI
jgi:hypothetical protein